VGRDLLYRHDDQLQCCILAALAEKGAKKRDPTTRAPVLSDKERIDLLERENRELRRANEILRLASAYFAKAELDRLQK
jgi:transposase-like protein